MAEDIDVSQGAEARPAAGSALDHLLMRDEEGQLRREFVEEVTKHSKVEILPETAVRRISGGERVESVALQNLINNETRILPVDVVLIRIGVEPNTEYFRTKLDLDKNGYIEADRNCQTSIKGIFAVGDAANPLSPTISSASGMGATAAKAIFSLLKS